MSMTQHQFQFGQFVEAQGGHFGGDFLIDGKVISAFWAPKALGETSAIWLPDNKPVTGASSYVDSVANTLAMAEAGSPLAIWATGLDINGKTDWVIPARDVLEPAYRHLKPSSYETYCAFRDGENANSIPAGTHYTEDEPIVQTTVEAFKKGGSEAFEEAVYWTSYEYSSRYAFVQNFGNGGQGYGDKDDKFRARAVRMVQLNP